jgi:nucleotide-binding universal stress UspA family protein
MSHNAVKRIICAVRGRPESRHTITRAIDLALEYQASLTFLHVIDAEFVEYATVAPLSVMYKEMSDMAHFAMLILCDRARRRGVANVDAVVLEGNIRKQLRKFAIETHADLMVVGAPFLGSGKDVFKLEELKRFIEEIEREGNLRIIQVSPKNSSTDS